MVISFLFDLKKPLWLLLSLSFVLTTPPALSQTADVSISGDSTDNAYITDFTHKYMVRLYLSNKDFSFNLRNRKDNKNSIFYAPNGRYGIGAGLFYGKAGLELGISIPLPELSLTKYGKTRSFDFQSNYYGNKVGGDLFLQRYKGFYMKYPWTVDSNWEPGSNYPQRPDIVALNLGGNIYYVFNHKNFSYRATFVQTERQVQSAGSFVLMGALSYMRFKGDRSLIPESMESSYGDRTDFRRGGFTSLVILPGYAHTFVKKRLYASFSIFMGVGLQQKHFFMGDQLKNVIGLARKNNLRIAAGYFGERFQGGASLIIDNTPVYIDQLTLSASSFNVKLFLGYRFSSKRIDQLIAKHSRHIKVFNRKP